MIWTPIISDHFPLPWNLSTADEIVTKFITNFSVFNPCSIISLTGQINKLHPPLWTPFDGKKTKGIWSFGIRLILACVQDSLIIQKSYNTSIMIEISSCVPALNTIIWYPLRLIVVMISVFYQELPTICIDNIHTYNVKYINVCP